MGWLCSTSSVTLALTRNISSYVGVLHECKPIMLGTGWISCLHREGIEQCMCNKSGTSRMCQSQQAYADRVFSAHSVVQMIPKGMGFACTLVLSINLPGNSFYGLPSFRFEPQKVKINLVFHQPSNFYFHSTLSQSQFSVQTLCGALQLQFSEAAPHPALEC